MKFLLSVLLLLSVIYKIIVISEVFGWLGCITSRLDLASITSYDVIYYTAVLAYGEFTFLWPFIVLINFAKGIGAAILIWLIPMFISLIASDFTWLATQIAVA